MRQWTGQEIIYQIYPRSFLDTTGSGEGDISGVEKRLPYLKALGVGAIWLSPFFVSPMKDGGYDVANYREVDPRFGHLSDVQSLIGAAHEQDIKVLIDFVGNHCSVSHPWFEEEAARPPSEDDMFIWRSANQLNNWRSVFSEGSYDKNGHWQWGRPYSAWSELPNLPPDHPRKGLYYLHTFGHHQADIDWSKPHVRKRMLDEMKFWLDLGVNGFRVDAANHMGKDPQLKNELLNPKYIPGKMNPYDELCRQNSANHSVIYDYLREMAELLKQYKAIMITEAYDDNPLPLITRYYKEVGKDVISPFNFGGFDISFTKKSFSNYLQSYHRILQPGQMSNHVLENHDKSRLVSRIEKQLSNGETPSPQQREQALQLARSLAVASMTLSGLQVVYQGQELGLRNVPIPKEKIDDPFGRDPARAPMPWTNEKNAGFTTGEPWLPLPPDFLKTNAAAQEDDPESALSLYRILSHLRRHSKVLREGRYRYYDTESKQVEGFVRELGAKVVATLINFSPQPVVACLPDERQGGKIILSSRLDVNDPSSKIKKVRQGRLFLRSFEAVLVEMNGALQDVPTFTNQSVLAPGE